MKSHAHSYAASQDVTSYSFFQTFQLQDALPRNASPIVFFCPGMLYQRSLLPRNVSPKVFVAPECFTKGLLCPGMFHQWSVLPRNASPKDSFAPGCFTNGLFCPGMFHQWSVLPRNVSPKVFFAPECFTKGLFCPTTNQKNTKRKLAYSFALSLPLSVYLPFSSCCGPRARLACGRAQMGVS